jgi:hypothetical protein
MLKRMLIAMELRGEFFWEVNNSGAFSLLKDYEKSL